MNLVIFIADRIAERDRLLNINDSIPGGDVTANAKAEQILDDLALLYKSMKQDNIESGLQMQILQDAFAGTYYAVLFK